MVTPVEQSTATTRDWPWARITAVAGLAYVALAVAGFLIPGGDVTPTDPLAVVRSYYADNRAGVLASVYLDTLGMVCLLAFAAGFGGLVARRGGDPWGILGRLMIAGALGSFAISTVENMAEAALAFRAASVGEAATVEALFDLLLMVPLTVLPLAALMAAAAVGIARSGLVPRWLGWLVLLPALCSVVGAAGLDDPRGPLAALGLFGGFFPFLLWTLAVSVTLLVRREAAAPAPTWTKRGVTV